MLYECQNYYPKLLDDYHFSFAANEGMPLYLALCQSVNMHKLLAQQIQRLPDDFATLPWKRFSDYRRHAAIIAWGQIVCASYSQSFASLLV